MENTKSQTISPQSKAPEPPLRLLALMYDRWEDGTPCYEDAEDCTGFLGHAVKLSAEEEDEIIALLKGIPRAAQSNTEPSQVEKLTQWKRTVENAFTAGMLGMEHASLMGGTKLTAHGFITSLRVAMRQAEDEFMGRNQPGAALSSPSPATETKHTCQSPNYLGGPCMECAKEKGLATGIDDGPPNSTCQCGRSIKCPIHTEQGE
jgi:hypothetical protein